ncbi:MAG: glycosyltransferase family 2 protein [Myxococcota bacterium]
MRASRTASFLRREVAARISTLTRYCDRLVQWPAPAWEDGELLELCDCEEKLRVAETDPLPDLSGDEDARVSVLLNGTFNYHFDIQGLLLDMRARLTRGSRVIAVCYNPYLKPVYRLADVLGLRNAPPPTTFVTHAALASIAKAAGYEIVRVRAVAHCPFEWFGLGRAINRLLSALPGVRNLALVMVVFLRPILPARDRPSLSVIVPARDERGNIEPALERLPDFDGADVEVIFVEGHSTDGTWEEIQRVVEAWKDRIPCRAYRQSGVGKVDAVRLGFSEARNELLTILDADLTMPPELLTRYYDAWCDGLADFINGSRLIYPMEGEAMRPLNLLGNLLFAKLLSFVLDMRISDSLCGTKLVSRRDHERFTAWRRDFGDFDPFGDFELLFPAATLALGCVDIPVRYRDRTYGSTSIRRFTHGWQLLQMSAVGLFRIKLGAG